MLKLVPPSILQLLADCFNKILRGEEETPDSWVYIRVKMLHKGKGKDASFWDSFRPVFISSCVGKLFNAILGKELLKHCMDQEVIDTSIQKGFLYNLASRTAARTSSSALNPYLQICTSSSWISSLT